jgi:hypothetical protein
LQHLQTSEEVAGGFPANQDPKRGTPDRTGPCWDFTPGSEGTRFRGSVPGLVLPREAIPTIRGVLIFDDGSRRTYLLGSFARIPGLKDPRGVLPGLGYRTWSGRSRSSSLPGKGPFSRPFRSHALQVASVRGRELPRLASDSIFRSEDRRISSMPFLTSDPGIRGEDCVPPFPPQGFSNIPSEEGI